MQRFRERWSEFYLDNNDEPAYDIAEPLSPPAARSSDPRIAYVQQFKDRWSEFQRQEDEEDPINIFPALVMWGLLVAGGNIALFIMDLPYQTQWIITGILTGLYLAACVVAWRRWKSRTHGEDKTL
jgi:hypothetical protein